MSIMCSPEVLKLLKELYAICDNNPANVVLEAAATLIAEVNEKAQSRHQADLEAAMAHLMQVTYSMREDKRQEEEAKVSPQSDR